ncbi:MAG: DUF892 family protein [Chitinispirillaceae bacterium]
MKLDTIEDLLEEQLHDLYSAEKEYRDSIPKLSEQANSPELRKAFNEQYEEARNQLNRLEEIHQKLGLPHDERLNEPVHGMVEESEKLMNTEGNPVVKDAAFIAAAQRVDHYEMAGYGCARTYAHELGYRDVEKMLQDTLEEVGDADKKFTRIAEGGFFSKGLNQEAPRK